MSTEDDTTKTVPPKASEDGGGGSVKKAQSGTAPTRRSTPAAVTARRTICCGLLAFIILLGVIALILYLLYRPSKPHFTVVSAAVYDLKASASAPATAISTSMQFTVRVRNPNERSSVVYDRLLAYVAYRDEEITPQTPLPPLYQDEDSTVAVSPLLGGGAPVPVSQEVASGLATDQVYGVVRLELVVLGRLKYKAGPFHSAWSGLFVRCELLTGFKKGMYGQVPLLGTPDCSVET